MDIVLAPKKLGGEITPPSSKSIAHRALIAAALADSPTDIVYCNSCDDIKATKDCLAKAAAQIKARLARNNCWLSDAPLILDCHDSASTLRFLIPLFSALKINTVFTGSQGLLRRPIKELLSAIGEKDLHIKGTLKAGTFTLSGTISSQYISGLLFALPLLKGDSKIILSSPLQSQKYVDLTIDILNRFGVIITKTPQGFFIKGLQKYLSPKRFVVEADWSSAAVWLTAAYMGSKIKISDLNDLSLQPDIAIKDIITKFQNSADLVIDIAQFPDLTPMIALLASVHQGTTIITNAERLRLKESDRLQSIYTVLHTLGADIDLLNNGLLIRGKPSLTGGTVTSFGDHRIVMLAAIASTIASAKIVIKDADSVTKSYPSFFDDMQKLGAKINAV